MSEQRFKNQLYAYTLAIISISLFLLLFVYPLLLSVYQEVFHHFNDNVVKPNGESKNFDWSLISLILLPFNNGLVKFFLAAAFFEIVINVNKKAFLELNKNV